MPETPDPEPVQQAQPPRKASQVKTYEFTSELETGNDLIDSEHKELIDAINNLLLACGEGKGPWRDPQDSGIPQRLHCLSLQ